MEQSKCARGLGRPGRCPSDASQGNPWGNPPGRVIGSNARIYRPSAMRSSGLQPPRAVSPQGPQPSPGGVAASSGVQDRYFMRFRGRDGRIGRGGCCQSVATGESRRRGSGRADRCSAAVQKSPISSATRTPPRGRLSCRWTAPGRARLAGLTRRTGWPRARGAAGSIAATRGAQVVPGREGRSTWCALRARLSWSELVVAAWQRGARWASRLAGPRLALSDGSRLRAALLWRSRSRPARPILPKEAFAMATRTDTEIRELEPRGVGPASR